MRIQRLQTRIIVFFVVLLALVQVAAFWFVNAANSKNAHAKIEEELNVGQRVFARLLEQNADKLKLSARVLAADFAFREAIATHDTGTIASVLSNHGARIGADAMVFVDLEGNVVSDTLRPDDEAAALRISGAAQVQHERCDREHGSARRPRLPAGRRAGARAAADRLGGHGIRRGRQAGARPAHTDRARSLLRAGIRRGTGTCSPRR